MLWLSIRPTEGKWLVQDQLRNTNECLSLSQTVWDQCQKLHTKSMALQRQAIAGLIMEKKRKTSFSTAVGYIQCQTASLTDSSTPQNFSVYSLILQLGHETAVLKSLRSGVWWVILCHIKDQKCLFTAWIVLGNILKHWNMSSTLGNYKRQHRNFTFTQTTHGNKNYKM